MSIRVGGYVTPERSLELHDAERFIVHGRRLLRGLDGLLSDEALSVDYRNFVFGGRRHRLGHWVSEPHRGLVKLHEASKALFCPMCVECRKHHAECKCGEKSLPCWRHVGQAPVTDEEPWCGEGEGAVRSCELHGEFHWRKSLMYSTVAAFPGNRWGKTSGCGAEFCAWVLGQRPWDGSLTALPGNDRIFVIVCQTLRTSGALNIAKVVDRYLRGHIAKRGKNTGGDTDRWWVDTAGGTDLIAMVSQEQHYKSATEASPLEGFKPYAAWYDEPVTGDVRSAVSRGLQDGKNAGWGRELFSGTPLEGSPQAAAYSFNEIFQPAWNRGGEKRHVFSMTGSIWDNPDNTPQFIKETLDSFPAHEREMREKGIYKTLRGRILSEFQVGLHVYDDSDRDVRLDPLTGEASDWPMWIAVDPHDVRPWVITVGAISPEGHWYVVDEWPRVLSGVPSFWKMRHYKDAGIDGSFEAYERVLHKLIEETPGGRRRFLWWVMDPAFGDSEKAGMKGTICNRLRQKGFYFRTDIPREIEPGHNHLRTLMRGSLDMEGYLEGKAVVDELHRPHFYVAEGCRNVVWSILNYVNDPGHDPAKFREKPAEAGKDFVDTLRYVAMLKPRYRSWREALTRVGTVASTSNNGLG